MTFNAYMIIGVHGRVILNLLLTYFMYFQVKSIEIDSLSLHNGYIYRMILYTLTLVYLKLGLGIQENQ